MGEEISTRVSQGESQNRKTPTSDRLLEAAAMFFYTCRV